MSVGAIVYARASTEELAFDALALAAQHDTAAAAVAARGWRVHASALDRGIDSSVAPDERPALGRTLADLAGGAAGALVVARLDRVSHSVRIWADLVERSYQQRWAIVVVEEGFESPSDSGEGAAALFAAAARVEQRRRSARARAGLAAARAGGTRLGRPIEHTPEARQLIQELRAAGNTYQQIADHLTAAEIPTARGGRWRASTVHRLLRSTRFDEQAVAGAALQDSGSTPAAGAPSADQAERAAEFDRQFPDSYNLSRPPDAEDRDAR
ncbi:MAG: recombinase family protein [bacterium]|nr:recombinase family protein [bacterium]